MLMGGFSCRLKEQADEDEEDEEEGERRPLVYEDHIGTDPDIHRRRRKSIALVLTLVCVGVGLSLAVALPLVALKGPKDEAPVVLESNHLKQEIGQPVQLGMTGPKILKTEEPKMRAEYLFGSSASSDFFTSSQEVTSDAPHPTTSPSSPVDPFATCPDVPAHRGGVVDLEFLEGKLLFELYRIQSEDSPATVAGISCSIAELDFSDGNNETRGHRPSNGTLTLRYLEGRRFFSRSPRTVQVNLTESASSSRDFVESFGRGDGQGRLSFLVQLDGFVLTYECFPSYPGDRRPGYVVHVFSLLPLRGEEAGLARALLRLADVWGLNPGRRPFVPVAQQHCDR